MQTKRGLGRGLESLMPPPAAIISNSDKQHRAVDIGSIVPNRLQPRTIFDEDKLRELASSIKEYGVLQPVIVSPISGGRYELIAGERRFRASKMAGLTNIPVVVKDVDDEKMLALSLLENIQREDLNAIEESRAYQELIEKFGYTQDAVAKKLGKSRVAVANSIRLLKLPRIVQDDVANERYSAGHARALLSLNNLHEQLKMRERILKNMPSVRDVESMVRNYASKEKKKTRKLPISPHMQNIMDDLCQRLGTKVRIMQKGKKGKIVVDYYSAQDLDRILGLLMK